MEDQNQVDIRFALIAGIFLLTLLSLSVVIFFILYRRRLYNKHKEMMQLESQHREQLLFSSITSAENERKRIAADIHDELGNIFVNLSFSLNKIESPGISYSRGLIDKGLDSVRRISRAIMPPELELYGLHFTIENLCDKINASDVGVTIDFSHPVDEFHQPPATSLAVYRILQELITNTLKHAGATHIDIRLNKNETHYTINYHDNGKGLNTTGAETASGLGLKNIESRVRMIKGNVAYPLGTDKGFTAEIIFPSINPDL